MKPRVMIFYDFENFKKSLSHRDRKKRYNYGKVQYLIIDLLRKFLHIEELNSSNLIRAYAYTGEYTKEIIQRMEREIEEMKKSGEAPEIIKKKEEKLRKTERRYQAQRELIKTLAEYHFFELRTYPLKYDGKQIFQKGVDVQLAVDLVTHAFRDNFDIAVVCSGDIDLLESLKIVKSLGKKVVIMSNLKITAKGIRKESDFFIDINRLSDKDLEKIEFVEKVGNRDG